MSLLSLDIKRLQSRKISFAMVVGLAALIKETHPFNLALITYEDVKCMVNTTSLQTMQKGQTK